MSTLDDILYGAVDGVFAVDAKQRIIFWNPGCEELFKRPSQAILGRPCNDVLCGMNPSSGAAFCHADCCVAQLCRGGDAPNRFSIKTRNADGKTMILSVDVLLLPSCCNKKWIVLHLLYRSVNQHLLNTLDQTSRSGRQMASLADCEKTLSRLTARETEVLQLLSEGLSSNVISKRFTISHTTVRNHIQHIQNKLGVHSQTEAVAYAYRHNLVM
ncbi:MAG: LuxR C-terminal-related transcriptional regulator [Gammaproteobacteria bacterium]|nr:LuxR C-terminal-related transcriptional regulator [Gammaproteobacteria bacterium]